MINRWKDERDIEAKTTIQVYLSHPWNLFKTCFLSLGWIIMGLYLELIGPTLSILAKQVNVNLTGISSILVARGGGYIAGVIVVGLMQDIVKRYSEGLLALAFLIASIVTLATPYIQSLMILCVAFFHQGIAQGITDLGGNNLIMTMWSYHAAAPLAIVHMGYGLGAVFGNLLVQPFLSENVTNIRNSSSSSSIETTKSSSINLIVPFSISASFCLLISIGYILFSIREHIIRQKIVPVQEVNQDTVSTTLLSKPKLNYSQYSPRTWGYGHLCYGLSMSIFGIAYMFFVGGLDHKFGRFYYVFLISPPISLSTIWASWGMIFYWLSYVVGRLISVILTLYVSVSMITAGLWICGLSLSLAWFVCVWVIGLTGTSLLVLGTFTGLIFSSAIPLAFGFFNQRLDVNPLLGSLLLCSTALGSMLFQKLGGIIMDYDSKYFPILLIICVLVSVLFFVLLFIVSHFHKRH